MKRRRVTVSPSKAPGYWRSAVYLDLVLRWRSSGTGRCSVGPGNLSLGRLRRREPRHAQAPRRSRPRLVGVAGPLLGRRPGAVRDEIGEDRDRVEVPAFRQFLEPGGVEA